MGKRIISTDIFVELPGRVEKDRDYRLNLVFVTPAGKRVLENPNSREALEHLLGSRLMPCTEDQSDRHEIQQDLDGDDVQLHVDVLCHGMSYAFRLFVDHRSIPAE